MIAQRYKDMLSGKSVIRQISEWSTARGTEIGYENVFDYSLGNPSVPCPEHFTKTCIDLLQTKEPVTLHGYSPTLTIPAVRKAVAESLNRRFGMDYGMEHIFMATGAAGALAHAMRCVAVPGQDIITFAPFFPEYKPYVEGAGLNLKVVPPRTKDFQIDFDAFDAMLDENTAAVLINTPNNPSGAAYSAETLTGLADRLRAASAKYGHRIFLISDEPYREIMFGGQPIQYVAKFYDDTLTCYSFSKSLSLPGERIGYVAANPRCEDAEYIVPHVRPDQPRNRPQLPGITDPAGRGRMPGRNQRLGRVRNQHGADLRRAEKAGLYRGQTLRHLLYLPQSAGGGRQCVLQKGHEV